MYFYIVTDDDATEGEFAYAWKCDALAHQKNLKSRGISCKVKKVTVRKLPVRDLLVAIFNREGYADDVQEVE